MRHILTTYFSYVANKVRTLTCVPQSYKYTEYYNYYEGTNDDVCIKHNRAFLN
jgi:hypothetical protein